MATEKHTFKYAKEIEGIKGCPPLSLDLPTSGHAYRFALSDKNAPQNFLPPALISPNRLVRGTPVKACCSYFALSFFTTLPQLRQRAINARKTSPQFLKLLGDHFFEAHLSDASGRVTKASNGGHFDLFEFDGFKLDAVVVSHAPLPI